MVNHFIKSASKDGKEILRLDAEGYYGGVKESSNFLTGDITQTDAQMIAMFLAQETYAFQGGLINTTTGTIYHSKGLSFNADARGTIHGPKDHTKVYTRDGSYIEYSLDGIDLVNKLTNDNVKLHHARFGAVESRNGNIFLDANDAATWNKTFNNFAKPEIQQSPFGFLDLKQNIYQEGALIERIGKDEYLNLDYSMVWEPAQLNYIIKNLQKNNKVNFVSFDSNGNGIKYKVEYRFDPKVDANSQAFLLGTKGDIPIENLPKGDGGFTVNRIVTLEPYEYSGEGGPVKPNKGLTENHLANINLEKFPKEYGPILREILDEVGDVGFKKHSQTFLSLDDQLNIALQPSRMTQLLDMIFIDGKKNSIWKKDGTPRHDVRTNFADQIGVKVLLLEALDAHVKNPTKHTKNLVTKMSHATNIITASGGRTLGSMRVKINNENFTMSDLTGISDDGMLLIRKALSDDPNPSTLAQRIVELRRNNLLSSTASIVRSTAGNTASLVLNLADQTVAGVYNEALSFLDKSLRPYVGGKPKGSLIEYALNNKQILDNVYFTEGFIKDSKQVPNLIFDILRGKVIDSPLAANEGFLSTPAWGEGPLGKTITFPQRVQIAIDAMIRKPAEKGFIYQYAHRIAREEGLSGQAYKARVFQLIENPTREMINMSKAESSFITFQAELGAMGKLFNRVRTGKSAASQTVQFVVPFFNTAANLFKRSYNMTPLGFISPQYWSAFSTGIKRGHWGKFADANARITVGTSLMYWANEGFTQSNYKIEGSWKDKTKFEREMLESIGHQPNSIWWKNENGQVKSWSYSGFEPMASLFNIVATLQETEGDALDERAVQVLNSWITMFQENPFMQGTEDLTKLMSGQIDLQKYMTKLFLGTLSPSILNQAGKIKDPIRYEIPFERDKVAKVTNLNNWYNELVKEFRLIDNKAGIPRVNIFGQPVVTPDPKGALLALRVSEEGVKKDEQYNVVANEFIRLAPLLGDLDFGRNTYMDAIDLTGEQKFLLEVAAGREFYNFFKNQIIGSYVDSDSDGYYDKGENGEYIMEYGNEIKEGWENLPDAGKVEMIKQAKNFILENQLYSIAPELFIASEMGELELLDKKEFVVLDEKQEFAERADIINTLTTRYRESTEGSKEIVGAERAADKVIVLMKRGLDKNSAIKEILNTLKEE